MQNGRSANTSQKSSFFLNISSAKKNYQTIKLTFMFKYLLRSALTSLCLFFITALLGQTSKDTLLTSTVPLYWKPPAGCKSFYVQLWGGGAGGNANWPSGQYFYNGTGGGGGGSFSESNPYTVTQTMVDNGFLYKAGLGGALNQNGTNSYFGNVFAYEGKTSGNARVKSPIGGEVKASNYGGIGGQSWRSLFGEIWHGGGGGSGRTNGEAAGGQTAGDGYHGYGGDGAGGGGMSGGSGNPAYIPGGGGSGEQPGARGQIKVFYTCENTAGEIGNAHTVPSPAEFTNGTDYITNVVSPTGVGVKYSWEDSTIGGKWNIMAGANNLTFAIPSSLQQDTWYRRRINGCELSKNLSNIIKITVFRQINFQSDGKISGKVLTDKTNSPVPGITITLIRTTPLKGSPANYPRTTTTDESGTYSFEGIFYGNPDVQAGNDSVNVYYTVIPSRQGHIFKPTSKIVYLSSSSNVRLNVDFKDTTVYSISGKVTQNCNGCAGPIFSFGVGNAKVSLNTQGVFDPSTDSLSDNNIGAYSTVVVDPKEYTFTPSYLNHKFSPTSKTFNLTNDTTGIDFLDTTTHQISGKLTDIAGKRIGSAQLVFQGEYQRKNKTSIPTFRKIANIPANDSTYSVTLPAGRYTVTVNTFTCPFATSDPRYVLEAEVKDFFNVKAKEPLIYADTIDIVRNLVYHRPPVIVVTGLIDTFCNTSDSTKPGIIFKSNIRRYFKADVFEGPASLNNRVQTSNPLLVDSSAADKGDFLRLLTNVTNRTASGNPETIFLRLQNAAPMLDTFLIPGAPNTSAPYKKNFEVRYIDRYGREASPQIRNATVTGTFSPAQTFITSFPEKPYLILHAPPGDQSYSFWSKGETAEVSTRFSVAKDSSRNEFASISFAPTVSITAGPVSFDAQIVAGLDLNRTRRSSTVTGKEEVSSVTSNVTFQTKKDDNFVKGNSGDVYVGAGKNYKTGYSTTIDFDETQPPGGCLIKEQTVLLMSPDSYRTEFAYAEDHITNYIIPTQQKFADEATDEQKRKDALQQISIWQQVIRNNQDNKRAAKLKLNRSFSYGVIVEESQTGTLSKANTLTYNVSIDTSVAIKLGLYYAGIGGDGGTDVTISETQGYDAASTSSTTTTMGYHLEDGDKGDFYSTDIKIDPEYGTPVFDLVAGTSSCPPEEGAQNRDVPQIISGDLRFDNLRVDTTFTFPILLTNKSESRESRFYMLSVDPTTSNGLIIGKNLLNDLSTTSVQYYLEYGQTLPVDIFVRKSNLGNKTLSYSNVEFYLTDICQVDNVFIPNATSTAKITFNYASQCGGITLAAPTEGWVANSSNPNTLPVTMGGYVLNSIDSVTLEYVKLGSKIWNTGFIVKKLDFINPTSFTKNWDITSLADTVYNLRLKLVCVNGDIIYSNYAGGVIDRKIPSLVGIPQPATKKYNPDAGEISFAYSELINNANLNSGAVEMIRRSNNLPVPVSVREENGKLIIKPVNSLGTAVDSFRVIVKNIADLSGNIKTKPDTSYFKLDFTPLVTYTGTNVAKVFVTPASIAENSTGKMELHFKLKEKATKITKVYFNLTGNATFNTDYAIAYDTIKRRVCVDSLCTSTVNLPVLNQFSGYPGFINIDSNKTEAIIYLDPTEDSENEGNETITATLVNGNDYKLTDSVAATGTILNSVPPCPPANILYVNEKATGSNTGVSWVNAMRSLKEAVNKACPNVTQIWVAKGIYKPTTNNSRDSSFVMKNNLTIYGGFTGTETSLSQRNIRTNPTILSGDIGIANSNADNSYNVVRNISNGLNSTAILDGFIVTGGNGNGPGFGSYGAGINNVNSTPSFYNCSIIGNSADAYGGGMYNNGASPLVINSVFAGNTALYGGGLYNESAATKLINCSFSGNLAFAEGGAISTYGANPQIANSIIWGNSSGIRNNASAPVVTYSIVQGGYAGTGNLTVDPLFILQPTQGLGTTADLRLQGCSPAINVASNAALPTGITTDLASLSRIVNTTVDMGAYERPATALSIIIYVDANAQGNNSGESWANAYTNFGSAITELNFCGAGTTIQVAAGTYFAPANTTLNLDKLNASILGGYPAGGGITRNPIVNPVIVRGNVQVFQSVRIDGIRVQKQ